MIIQTVTKSVRSLTQTLGDPNGTVTEYRTGTRFTAVVTLRFIQSGIRQVLLGLLELEPSSSLGDENGEGVSQPISGPGYNTLDTDGHDDRVIETTVTSLPVQSQ
jgi:hypothetical protein